MKNLGSPIMKNRTLRKENEKKKRKKGKERKVGIEE